MTLHYTLTDGAGYTVDPDIRTITVTVDDPQHQSVAILAANMLTARAFVGPQTDEFTGLHADWSNPVSVFHAIRDAATLNGFTLDTSI